MSDFQKLTLKRLAIKFLVVCAGVGVVWAMIKFERVRYLVIVLSLLSILSFFIYMSIIVARWDWRLRGLLTKDEYEAYMACDTIFGYRDDKYIPTEAQIKAIVYGTKEDPDLLWSMYRKLNEGVQS